ncbi:MAG: squalene synthase HpnC [Bryobacteraceae bacterium]|nr:squalene synthase HpnC [Bryobacteraceae bacterium]MDW8377047.1 squalene synthase HpnC [Bryobacterales bacterium]
MCAWRPVFLYPRDFLQSAGAQQHTWNSSESEQYTRWLATNHYENFPVVSILLPKRLHQDFFNVYAFCRWADDLGDEIGDPKESLRLLAWWREELDRMYSGQAAHPVFIALQNTVRRHDLPQEPFADLIDAFVQDQQVRRYPDWTSLLDYCKRSANPVGRLVLALCGYRDAERQRLADATCTALQLANFWQDVTVDLLKDRVYIPLEVMAKHGYSVEQLFARSFTPAFRSVMVEVVAKAHEFFEVGLQLPPLIDRRLAIDIELFSRGGLKILDKIAAQDYNVLAARPVLSKLERIGLLFQALWRVSFAQAA